MLGGRPEELEGRPARPIDQPTTAARSAFSSCRSSQRASLRVVFDAQQHSRVFQAPPTRTSPDSPKKAAGSGLGNTGFGASTPPRLPPRPLHNRIGRPSTDRLVGGFQCHQMTQSGALRRAVASSRRGEAYQRRRGVRARLDRIGLSTDKFEEAEMSDELQKSKKVRDIRETTRPQDGATSCPRALEDGGVAPPPPALGGHRATAWVRRWASGEAVRTVRRNRVESTCTAGGAHRRRRAGGGDTAHEGKSKRVRKLMMMSGAGAALVGLFLGCSIDDRDESDACSTT